MNQSRFFLLVFAAFFLVGCQTAAEDVDLTTQVELAEETEPVFPLEAGFMSDSETFAYTFNYNGYLLKIMDAPLEGASSYGPSFQVEGGAEITGSTVRVEDADTLPSMDGDCSLTKKAAVFGSEALILTLRLCPDDDAALGQEAFDSLFEGLTMVAL